MPAPSLYFDEAAAMGALLDFVTAVLPLAAVDVYRVRPAATPGRWKASVLLAPVTPLPIAQSRLGEEHDGKQAQRWQVSVTTAAAGAWSLGVLGETSVPYLAGGADPASLIRDELRLAVDALGLPVATADSPGPNGAPGFTVTGDVVGVSLAVTAAAVPAGGSLLLQVVDDNVRRAVSNQGIWTIRAVVRDVAPAGGGVASNAGPYAELLRLSMQASSRPVTNGLAYPYLRDRLQEAKLSWRQTLGPFNADEVDGGVWVRGVALDFAFDVPIALLHDVPSLDAVRVGEGYLVLGPVG